MFGKGRIVNTGSESNAVISGQVGGRGTCDIDKLHCRIRRLDCIQQFLRVAVVLRVIDDSCVHNHPSMFFFHLFLFQIDQHKSDHADCHTDQLVPGERLMIEKVSYK